MSLRTPVHAPRERRARPPAPPRVRAPRNGIILRGAGVVPATVAPGPAFEMAPWPCLVVDADGKVVAANEVAKERLGAMVGAAIESMFAPGPLRLPQLCARAVADGAHLSETVSTVAGWTGQLHLYPLRLGAHAVAMVRPSGAEAQRDGALRAHEDRFQALCEHAPAGILTAQVGMRVDYVNDRCAEVFGAPAEDLWGFGWLGGLETEDDVDRATAAAERALAGMSEGPLPLRVRRPDGTIRSVEARFAPNGGGGGFVATVEDVTDAHRLAERLEYQARHDSLTGLGNRREMVAAIDDAVRDLRDGRISSAALVFIDLDNFKYVNDTLGHEAGDQLLTMVAERLVHGVRHGVDVVTRFGGDEFVILLPDASVEDHASETADRLVDAIAAPYLLDGHPAVVTASAGIVDVDGSSDAEGVLRDADVAMYQAKRAGKNRAALFSPDARAAAESYMAVLTALRATLQEHPERFQVVYQPICGLDGSVVALEALARWTDPDLGPVAPDLFITAAEASGFADRIGELVRGAAIRDAATWRNAGWDGYVSVNVSAEELGSDRLVRVLTSQLEEAGLPGTALCAEVTETSVMSDPEAARRILDDLASHGIRVAIDDFGTGHSSLAYLKRFPVSVLKLDREFVDGVEVDGEDRAICSAIVALAGSLGLKVTAEGVETQEQLAALTSLGVDSAQGWLFSTPVPPEKVPALLSIEGPEVA